MAKNVESVGIEFVNPLSGRGIPPGRQIVFDVTEDCPPSSGHKQVLFQYGRDGRDLMIQISASGNSLVTGLLVEQWRCHFHFIEVADGFDLEGPDAFSVVAGGLALTSDDLYALIMAHLPVSMAQAVA